MKPILSLALVGTALVTAIPAQALDPNTGTQPYQPTVRNYRLPENIVPRRYYGNTPAAPAPVQTPRTAITYTPLAETAATRYVPIEQPVAQPLTFNPPAPVYAASAAAAPAQPVYYTPPQPAYAPVPAPQIMQVAPYNAPASAPRHKRDQYSLGIEGYYDEYQEDSVNLTDQGVFGSLTGNYVHYFSDQWYGELDLRASYGKTDYESDSGTINGIPQWEFENRVLAGRDYTNFSNGGRLKTYFGLGTRYFRDELKGYVSSLGDSGYDRRIFQLYLPIGATYEFQSGGLTFVPNIEVDPLLWGNVSSRLGTIPGYYNVENRQNKGYGIRAEFMMGQTYHNGSGWQFGPFLRYWDVPDSDVTSDLAGDWIEPDNTRLQAGAKLKVLF